MRTIFLKLMTGELLPLEVRDQGYVDTEINEFREWICQNYNFRPEYQILLYQDSEGVVKCLTALDESIEYVTLVLRESVHPLSSAFLEYMWAFSSHLDDSCDMAKFRATDLSKFFQLSSTPALTGSSIVDYQYNEDTLAFDPIPVWKLFLNVVTNTYGVFHVLYHFDEWCTILETMTVNELQDAIPHVHSPTLSSTIKNYYDGVIKNMEYIIHQKSKKS